MYYIYILVRIKILPFYTQVLYFGTLMFVCILPAYSMWMNNYLYRILYIKYLQPPYLNGSL